MSLVSVIIPTYNRGKTIKRAIDSVLHQTYQKLEIIIVDDCSEDNTAELINEIGDIRIQYMKLEHNSGACVARNIGVSRASGDYIAFQDSDDYWHSDKLEKQMRFIVEHNYDFISCGFTRITKNKKHDIGIKICSDDPIQIWCELLNGNWVSTQTILCRKECFNKIHFDKDVKRFQDWDIALQAAQYYKIGSFPESLVDVFLQDDSITKNIHAYSATKYILDKHFKYIDTENKRKMAQFYKSYGDNERIISVYKAGKYYLKSFIYQKKIGILGRYLLCISGLMKLYKHKYTDMT